MTTTTDLCYLPLHELAGRLRSKDVSPVEATEAVLERIERLNPKLNAYITVMADQALAGARTAADEIAAGGYRGPLHGVPVAVKDLCQTKGVRTTAASKILADWVPDEDATIVRKLREAGAILVGKLNLHEFAFGTTGVSHHFGPARNPWNADYITGGSSSGSGAAVAAGLCFAAIGSDTGGSIRIPASLCGIAGMKPTYGRVSVAGVVPLSSSLDHLGPMARTTRDCALMLGAIAGHDPADPHSADAPVEDWAAALDGASLAGVRIGVANFAFEQADPEVGTLVRAAIDALGRLGAELAEIDLAFLKDYWAATSVVLIAEAAAYHRENIEQRAEDFGDDVRARLQGGLGIPVADYIRSYRFMEEVRRTCDETLLKDVDLLALPTALKTAVPIETVIKDDPTIGLTLLTGQFDLTGQPAMSVPCGLTSAGLPVGLQLVGRRFDERAVLRAAHVFETQSGISIGHPPVE